MRMISKVFASKCILYPTNNLTFACSQASIISCASRSEEHTSELQSLMRISYAVFCLKKKNYQPPPIHNTIHCLHFNVHTTYINTVSFNSNQCLSYSIIY